MLIDGRHSCCLHTSSSRSSCTGIFEQIESASHSMSSHVPLPLYLRKSGYASCHATFSSRPLWTSEHTHTQMSISYPLHSAWLRPSHSSRALLAFALCFRRSGDEAAAAMNDDHCKHTWLSAPDNKAKFTSPTETMLAAKLHISKSFFSARPTRK